MRAMRNVAHNASTKWMNRVRTVRAELAGRFAYAASGVRNELRGVALRNRSRGSRVALALLFVVAEKDPSRKSGQSRRGMVCAERPHCFRKGHRSRCGAPLLPRCAKLTRPIASKHLQIEGVSAPLVQPMCLIGAREVGVRSLVSAFSGHGHLKLEVGRTRLGRPHFSESTKSRRPEHCHGVAGDRFSQAERPSDSHATSSNNVPQDRPPRLRLPQQLSRAGSNAGPKDLAAQLPSTKVVRHAHQLAGIAGRDRASFLPAIQLFPEETRSRVAGIAKICAARDYARRRRNSESAASPERSGQAAHQPRCQSTPQGFAEIPCASSTPGSGATVPRFPGTSANKLPSNRAADGWRS